MASDEEFAGCAPDFDGRLHVADAIAHHSIRSRLIANNDSNQVSALNVWQEGHRRPDGLQLKMDPLLSHTPTHVAPFLHPLLSRRLELTASR